MDQVLTFCPFKHSYNLLTTHPDSTLSKQICDFADRQCAATISVQAAEHSVDVLFGLDLGVGS
jgi:hypothetical protein